VEIFPSGPATQKEFPAGSKAGGGDLRRRSGVKKAIATRAAGWEFVDPMLSHLNRAQQDSRSRVDVIQKLFEQG